MMEWVKPDCNEVKDSNGSRGVCYGVHGVSGVSKVDMEGIRAVFIGFMGIMVLIHKRDIERKRAWVYSLWICILIMINIELRIITRQLATAWFIFFDIWGLKRCELIIASGNSRWVQLIQFIVFGPRHKWLRRALGSEVRYGCIQHTLGCACLNRFRIGNWNALCILLMTLLSGCFSLVPIPSPRVELFPLGTAVRAVASLTWWISTPVASLTNANLLLLLLVPYWIGSKQSSTRLGIGYLYGTYHARCSSVAPNVGEVVGQGSFISARRKVMM